MSRCRAPLVLASPILCLLSACGSGTSSDPAVVIEDSAGIRIVDSARPRTDADGEPLLSSQPLISIGVVEGESAYELDNPIQVLLQADGGVVIADRSREIRFFDHTGLHLYSVGGEGEGPGEFSVIRAMYPLAADSLLIYDTPLNRFTLLAGDGTLASVWTGDVRPPRGVMYGRRAVWVDQAVAPSAPESPGVLESAVSVIIAGLDGSSPDTSARGRIADSYVIPGRGSTGVPYPYQPDAAILGRRIVFGIGSNNQVDVLDQSGHTVALYRWAGARVPITQEMREADLERRRQLLGPLMPPADLNRFNEALPFPDSLPAFDHILADRHNGRIWIREYSARDQPETWLLFEAEGEWIGKVELPLRFRLMDILQDRLIGIWLNDLDVAFVMVYEIEVS